MRKILLILIIFSVIIVGCSEKDTYQPTTTTTAVYIEDSFKDFDRCMEKYSNLDLTNTFTLAKVKACYEDEYLSKELSFDLCSEINMEEVHDNCFRLMASEQHDFKICGRMDNITSKDNCYLDFATDYITEKGWYRPNICSLIVDRTKKSTCESYSSRDFMPEMIKAVEYARQGDVITNYIRFTTEDEKPASAGGTLIVEVSESVGIGSSKVVTTLYNKTIQIDREDYMLAEVGLTKDEIVVYKMIINMDDFSQKPSKTLVDFKFTYRKDDVSFSKSRAYSIR